MTREKISSHFLLQKYQNVGFLLAGVASVSVRSGVQRESEEGNFGVFPARKWG